MQRRWNVFRFLITTLWLYVSHVYKNHQMTRTKFIIYLQRFHKIAISENTSKYGISERKILILGFPFSKSGCFKPSTFSKELHHGSFLSLVNFFRTDKRTTLGESFRKY